MNKNVYSNINTNNLFNSFINNDKGDNAVKDKHSKSLSAKQYNNKAFSEFLEQQDAYLASTYEPIKPKRKYKGGLIAFGTTATVATAGFFIAVMTGKTHAFGKKLNSMLKRANIAASKSDSAGFQRFISVTQKVVSRVVGVLTNITPAKDIAFREIMYLTPPTKAIWKSVTGMYSGINKKATQKAAKESLSSYHNFLDDVEKIIYDAEASHSSCVEHSDFPALKNKLKEHRASSPKFYIDFDARHAILNQDMANLHDSIGLREMFSKKALKTFVPEDVNKVQRENYVENLQSDKQEVSYTYKNLYDDLKDSFFDINETLFSIKDAKTKKKLRLRTQELEESFIKLAEAKHHNRNECLKLTKELVVNYKDEFKNLPVAQGKSKMNIAMNKIEHSLSNYGEGSVEEIRELVGKVWNKGSIVDKKVKQSANNFIETLDRAASSELKMYDKERDISLGSGPTDILGLVAPSVLFAKELDKAETTDEKVGVTLQTGIPVIGAVASYIQTLAWQFSGSYALMTSLGVAVLLNFMGETAFKKYSQMKQEGF